MPCKSLSIRLVLPCVRMSSCLEPQAPLSVFLFTAYSIQAIGHFVHGGTNYHLKEGKQIPCGAGLLLPGKTLLRTVHSSPLKQILIFILKSLLMVYSGYMVGLLFLFGLDVVWPLQSWKSSLRACKAPRPVRMDLNLSIHHELKSPIRAKATCPCVLFCIPCVVLYPVCCSFPFLFLHN